MATGGNPSTRSIGTNTEPWPTDESPLPSSTSNGRNSPTNTVPPADVINDWIKQKIFAAVVDTEDDSVTDDQPEAATRLDDVELNELTVISSNSQGQVSSSDPEQTAAHSTPLLPDTGTIAPETDTNTVTHEQVPAPAPTQTTRQPRSASVQRLMTFVRQIPNAPYIPFLGIVLFKITMDHFNPAITLVNAIIGFFSVDHHLKKEVGKARPSWSGLLKLAGLLVFYLGLVCVNFAIYDKKFYCAFYYSPASIDLTSIWSLLVSVIITDYLVKLLAQFFKFLVLSLPADVLPFKSRGKYYSFIEHSSQLYRSTLPFLPWYSYFRHAYPEGKSHILAVIFGYVLLILYCIFKAVYLMAKAKYWLKSVKKLLTQEYGKTPTAEELEAAGNGAQCAICYDDFKSPIRLLCSHIYCKTCISQWLDRHRTCPTCRVVVCDSPTFRDGSTTHFVQAF